MSQVPFLLFPISSIRRSIKDIDDSYRNPWDILAELSQNAIDAIKKLLQLYPDFQGKIEIHINAQEKSISFKDNGCGIPFDELPKLLNLFSSGKSDDSSSVGEKGVGLKFVMFQSKEFIIESSDGQSAGRAIVKDARLWKKSTSDDELLLDVEEIDLTNSSEAIDRGTKIIVKDVELDNDDGEEQNLSIFQLSFDQLKFILRSKTYLGTTASLWDDTASKIEILLNYVDFNGVKYEEVLPNSYMLPIEGLSPNDVIDLDDFERWNNGVDRSDTDKRNKLQGKVIVSKGSYLHNGYRKISYWACFLPTRRDWDTVNVKLKLMPSIDQPADWKDCNKYALLSSGIFTSTKGMPTGISIVQPNSGNAGYWSNIFMIFQDDALTFDIGRKSIHGRVQTIYQTKAKEIFNSIVKYVTKYTSATPAIPDFVSSFDRLEITRGLDKIVNLNSNKVVFDKVPSEQEASVSAIFFELVGNGVISDIKPIYLGYRNKYDLYANYSSQITNKDKFVICEFKSHLKHLTKDFSEARKVFDEMDYVICWDVNDTDIQELYDFGIGCEEVNRGSLHSIDCPACVTHMLTIPNCNPVYVIDLKASV